MFRTVPMSIIRSYSLYIAMVCHTGLLTAYCVYSEELLMMDR